MIDKVIHQIWVGAYPIPEREYFISNEIQIKHPQYAYKFWEDRNIPEIPERLQGMYNLMHERRDYALCADILRWLVVYEYGGWYLDIDFEYVNNLDSLELTNRDGIVFGHWGEGWQHCDYTIANNVFAFEKKHPFVLHMIQNMPVQMDYSNVPCSPAWAGMEMKRYIGLENEFSREIWHYHSVVRANLDAHNIEYGDYNKFQNDTMRHHALYSWEHSNKEKFAKGLIK
jgi:mannosyltransferase OCH1-like enzyme